MSKMPVQQFITRATLPLETVGDGWTLYGQVVPFAKRQHVTDDGRTFYWEEFDPHSFDRDVSLGGRWANLMVGHHGHEGERFLGRTRALFAETDGLYAEVRIEDTAHPLAEAARSGELTRWSVGAKIYRTRDIDGVKHRMTCGISHIAATASAQYDTAGVLTVRDKIATPRLDHWRKIRRG